MNITISQITLPNWRYGNTSGFLRIFSNSRFTPSGEVTLIQRGNPNNNTWYQQIAYTVTGTNVTFAESILPATTDSTNKRATFSAIIYDDAGVILEVFLAHFAIPVELNPTTWVNLIEYKTAHPGASFDLTVYNTTQVDYLIAQSITGNLAPDATTTVKGKTRLSVVPIGQPIAVGDNDPRFTQIAEAVAVLSGGDFTYD